MYGSGSALCFVSIKISSFLFNEPYAITRYFSKIVASYSTVRLMYEKKKSKQFMDYALDNPVSFVVHKTMWYTATKLWFARRRSSSVLK